MPNQVSVLAITDMNDVAVDFVIVVAGAVDVARVVYNFVEFIVVAGKFWVITLLASMDVFDARRTIAYYNA